MAASPGGGGGVRSAKQMADLLRERDLMFTPPTFSLPTAHKVFAELPIEGLSTWGEGYLDSLANYNPGQ